MFEKEAEEYCTQQKLLEDVRDNICNAFQDGAEFGYNKANEWHYIGEEGLPAEVDKYYFIAYQTVLGLSGGYCKLIEKTRPIVNVFENTITGYETTKMWECEDSETMAYLNERGRVYAWKSLPDLPEYREYR